MGQILENTQHRLSVEELPLPENFSPLSAYFGSRFFLSLMNSSHHRSSFTTGYCSEGKEHGWEKEIKKQSVRNQWSGNKDDGGQWSVSKASRMSNTRSVLGKSGQEV